MTLANILASVTIIPQVNDVALNWIGKFIGLIINNLGFGSIGVGIIVFSLLLRVAMLPIDIYSKVATKKQSLKMEEMREKLEKLQKQYANDKQLYNQKMQELYKKNGYSMFSACIPMILSLVIFIVVLNAFSAYSQFACFSTFKGMANAYNQSYYEYSLSDNDVQNLNGQVITDSNGKEYILYSSSEEGRFLDLRLLNPGERANFETVLKDYGVEGMFNEEFKKQTDDKGTYIYAPVKFEVVYELNTAKAMATLGVSTEEELSEKLLSIGQTSAKEYYSQDNDSFLWIGNVWYPDVMWKHPVGSYADMKSYLNQPLEGNHKFADVINEAQYDIVTGLLAEEKSAANGYFVMIVLSIGSMLLSQFIMMKMQKSTNELQTVDGQGVKSQKMMLIIMPIIFGVFSFTYSSAFSIYMTVSQIFSTITTIIIGKILDKIFEKKKNEAFVREKERHLNSVRKNVKNK